MIHIKNNILDTKLIREEYISSLITHIPHSSLVIPNVDNYLISEEELDKENLKLSDVGTNTLFNLGPYVTSLVFQYSRLFCDVERLPDADEEMFEFGRGFFYTKTDDGRDLRTTELKETVQNLYEEYHATFDFLVDSTLEAVGFATIIDCHSFSDKPFETDLIKERDRPDICIGTDDFHTPDWLKTRVVSQFESLGYKVKINNPYSGTIVPLKHYKKNKEVSSIMIEVNRKLFTNFAGTNIDYSKLLELNRVLKKIFYI